MTAFTEATAVTPLGDGRFATTLNSAWTVGDLYDEAGRLVAKSRQLARVGVARA